MVSCGNVLGIGLIALALGMPSTTTAEWDSLTGAAIYHNGLTVTSSPRNGRSAVVMQKSFPNARDYHHRLFKQGLGGISTYGEGGY